MPQVNSPVRAVSQISYLCLVPLTCYISLFLLLSFFFASPVLADGPPFTRQRALVAGTTAVATGDLNGDGALDIIARYGGQDIIHLNDGAGNFNGSLIDCAAPPADAHCFGSGEGINLISTVADMNGDGALDIISSGYDPSGGPPAQSVIYLNDGAGNFYAGPLDCAVLPDNARCFGPAQSNITSLAVSDLDGDGALDIIAGGNQSPSVVYLNNGTGNFYAGPVDCATLPENARCFGQNSDLILSIAVGDMDRDSDLDIVAGTNMGSFVFLNDGTGHFYAGPVDCAASPTGVRCFGPLNYSIVSLALGDVNDDGALDIVAGSFSFSDSQPSTVYLNDGAGHFYAGPTPCSTPSNNVRCFGPETYSANVVALADMDSDGDLDIVLGNSDTILTGGDQDSQPDTLYLNDGAGNFSAGPSFGLSRVKTSRIIAVDINGDGGLDVISTGGIDYLTLTTLFLNDLGTDFTTFRYLGQLNEPGGPNFSGASSLGLGDMNGDGHLDVVVGQNDQDEVFLNDGTGNFAVEHPFGPAGYAERRTRSLAVADLDGDSDLDIIIGAAPNLFDGTGGQDRVYLNDGSGNFYAGPVDCAAAPANVRCFGPDNVNTASVAAGDMNGDGRLDLVVGNEGQPNVIYLNDGSGNFYAGPVDCAAAPANVHCFGPATGATSSLVLGDMEGDGDLDIIAATSQQGQIYLNDGGGNFYMGGVNCTNTLLPVRCFGPGDNTISSVALGDMDGDGQLDIIAGTPIGQNAVYLNDGAAHFALLSPNVCAAKPGMRCFGSAINRTTSLVVADFDGDGDLDIINGNNQDLDNQLYFNDGNGNFSFNKPLPGTSSTAAVAAGDVNGDGTLDIAVGYNGNNLIISPSFVLLNGQAGPAWLANNPPRLTVVRPGSTQNAPLFSTPVIQSGQVIPISYTLSDPEGDPVGRVAAFYSLNGGGQWFPATPTTDTITTQLATAYSARSTSPLALPDSGSVTSPPLSFTAQGSVERLEITLNISHTNNSHLSATLVAPSGRNIRLFENLPGNGAGLDNVTFSDQMVRPISFIAPDCVTFSSPEIPNPDQFFAGQQVSILTVQGLSHPLADVSLINLIGSDFLSDPDQGQAWSLTSPQGTSVVLPPLPTCSTLPLDSFSFNLAAGETTPLPAACDPDPISFGWTFNAAGLAALAGENGNGIWTLTSTNPAGSGSLDGWGLRTCRWPPLYGTYQPVEPLAQLRGEPLDGPYQLVITDNATGETGTLTSWSLKAIGVEHLYTWDTFASNILGQSDNVVLRLVAYPPGSGESAAAYRYPHMAAGPNQRPYAASVTFPFRVRGAQVQVISGTTGVANAMVYRLPAGQPQGGLPLGNAGQPFRTDSQGYLQGRGQIALGDQLLALAPVSLPPIYTARYSDSLHLYYTNGTAAPEIAGLNTDTITQPGVQQLLVSPDKPLLLFDLVVSLEWDASSDPVYLQQLEFDLQRASEHLYDFTDGHVALGKVTLYQNKEQWDSAHVRVLATNRLRPFAVQGGIVLTETIDPDHPAEPDQIVYDIGQVVMGATWNRYGNAGQNLGQDWPLALAHELSHFLLFLDDTYLGLNADQLLVAVDTQQPNSGCTGSAMGDVYTPDNSEFIFDETFWQQRCGQTLPAQTLNRDEWATISLWYPWLKPPAVANPGPSLMPFDLTDVVLAPFTPTNTLADPTFSLDYVDGAVSSSEGQGFLFRNEDNNPADYETIINLGSPAGGQNRLLARGARPGDRLCAFDPPRRQFGCEVIALGDERLSLRLDDTWTPFIQLTPVNTTTFSLAVSNLPGGLPLKARLYPDDSLPTAVIDLVETNGIYEGQFPSFEEDTIPVAGNIAVWVEPDANPRREAVVAFSIGGNPPHSRGGGSHSRGGGPHSRGGGAPLVSPDGQFIFFTPNPNDFGQGEFYTIQAMSGLPTLPPGKKAIGPSYNLVAFPGNLEIPGSISFQYLGLDALLEQVDETELTIHFWDGHNWRALATYRDAYYNLASALSQGPGVYALLAGVAEPVIAAVTPSAATNELTRTITISGGYFLPPLEVALVGPTATYTLPLGVVTPYSLTAVVTQALSAAEYQVRVVNGDGAVSPTPGIFALYDPAEACFYDFFESGAGKWVRSGDWAITSLPSGEQVMTDSPTGPYKSAQDYSSTALTYTTAITSLPFSLAECSSPILIFEHAYSIVPNDAGRIEISADDGATWQTLATYTNNSSAGLETHSQSLEWANVAWQPVQLSLNAYTGTVRLRFGLEVDQDVAAKGWVLDNLVVREGSTPALKPIFLPIVAKR
jgi:subtilisin-like proprotein convertase family protein